MNREEQNDILWDIKAFCWEIDYTMDSHSADKQSKDLDNNKGPPLHI